MKEATMTKLIVGLMAIYFSHHPHLQYLSWLGDLKLYVAAAALALVATPILQIPTTEQCELDHMQSRVAVDRIP
jgi:hypothetical protein